MFAATANAATLDVTTGGTDTGDCTGSPCATIAYAVGQAAADDTIDVGPGTFTGAGQVVIDKNLTLSGAGADDTTLEPGFDTSSSGSWIQVNDGNTFNVNQLALDGDGNDLGFGVRYVGSAGGAIDSVAVRNIGWDHPYIGIAISTNKGGSPDPASGDLDISNSTFENIRRVGVLYKGSGVTGTFEGNTYEGKGDGDFLDYALDISAGADIDVTENTVSDNRGVASTDGSTSAGFLVSTFWGAGTEATFTGNTVTDNGSGIHVGFDGSDASAVSATSNRIVGNEFGVVSTAAAIDAENNWWGCNGGPGSAGCDITDGTVDSNPHVVLDVAAVPSSINTGGATSQLSAEFAGSDGSEPELPFDGMPVGWTTDLASLASASSNVADELAANTLTSGATVGTATVTATFDNATPSAQVTITEPPPADPGPALPGPSLPDGPSDLPDDIVGTDTDDVLEGLGGDDTILGGLGDDLIKGGAGNDEVSGGTGADEVGGGRGADTVEGGEGDDVLRGGPGPDALDGGPGEDEVSGNRGQDEITADDGDRDRIDCGPNVDTVVADANDDVNANCENVS